MVQLFAARTRRSMLHGAAPAAGGVLAAACNTGGTRTEARPVVPQGPVQISFATDWQKGVRRQNIHDALRLWQERHPNVTVEARFAGTAEAKLLTHLAAGTPPDVVLFGAGSIAELQASFVDLMPFIKRDKFDMKDWIPVHPALLIKGGQFGMPFQYNMNAWYFNKSLFDPGPFHHCCHSGTIPGGRTIRRGVAPFGSARPHLRHGLYLGGVRRHDEKALGSISGHTIILGEAGARPLASRGPPGLGRGIGPQLVGGRRSLAGTPGQA